MGLDSCESSYEERLWVLSSTFAVPVESEVLEAGAKHGTRGTPVPCSGRHYKSLVASKAEIMECVAVLKTHYPHRLLTFFRYLLCYLCIASFILELGFYTMESVEFGELASLYRKNTVIKAIIDWLDGRERDPRNRETKVGNLQGDLSNRGERFPIEQLRDALEKIAGTGCGTYQAGRPIEKSRINWGCSAREIAAIVKEQLKSSSAENRKVAPVDTDFVSETHYFPVRPGISLPVQIRSDMTATELENMSEFLRVIARSRVDGVTR